MYDKTKITYETYETEGHGYRQTHVVIREMYEEDTAAHLEGTVDNKAGYGTLAHAEAAGRRFNALLEAGHTTYYDHSSYGLHVHLRWQHYEVVEGKQTYCSITYEDLGRSFGQLEKGMAFVKKIARRIEKDRFGEVSGRSVDNLLSHPEEVMAVLGRMKKTTQVRFDSTNNFWVKA